MRGRVGRHQTNLYNVIKRDLTDRNIQLVNTNDLIELRYAASDRSHWRKMFKLKVK